MIQARATKSASWQMTQGELGPRTREVVTTLSTFPEGLTAWEIADRIGRYVHAVRPRLTELHRDGLVVTVGTRWQPKTERHEAIWRLVYQESDGQLAFA